MPKRKAPEVNAGSMADIAFLLLIFFLVTSEMSKEAGQFQLLSEKVEGPPPEPVNERNVIEVLVNDNNLIRFEDKEVKMEEIPALVKEMILNSSKRTDWPESRAITKEELQIIIEKKEREMIMTKPKTPTAALPSLLDVLIERHKKSND